MAHPHQDAKYKKYALAVEKNLQLFESIDEWADIISFLTKFCKTLSSFPNFHNVPKKVLVSKRLAQCLNPALPSGVHQKALETYAIIFEKLGKQKLVSDFHIYSYGILPFFRHCSLTVRNTYLSIYKKYLLPLCSDLPSCLKSLVLAILPGLEEESNEHFDQIMDLLNVINQTVEEAKFFQCIWNCLLYSPNQRLSIINLLARVPPLPDYPSRVPEQDKVLMATAIGSALNDHTTLVVRGSLELIIKLLPIDSEDVHESNILFICKAVLHVFLKRDISLSRRCISWIYHHSEGSDAGSHVEHCLTPRSIDLISKALKRMLFSQAHELIDVSVPFKIMVALLDKPEMGLPICKQVMMDVMASIYLYHDALNLRSADILEAANIFFEVVDLHIVWSTMYQCFNHIENFSIVKEDGTKIVESKDLLPILLFAIKHLKITDNEAEHIHLPFFLYRILFFLRNQSLESAAQDMMETDYVVRICMLIIEKIPQSYLKISSKEPSHHYEALSSDEMKEYLDEFYMPRATASPLRLPSPKSLFHNLMEQSFGVMKDTFKLIVVNQMGAGLSPEISSTFSRISTQFAAFIDWACFSYSIIFQPKLEDSALFVSAMHAALNAFLEIDSIDLMSAIVRISIKLCKFAYYKPALYPIFFKMIPKIYEELWKYFDLEQAIQRLRIVELFWSIQSSFSSDEMDNFFALLLSEPDESQRVVNMAKFSMFWEISNSIPFMSSTALKKCLFIMIDTLESENISARRSGMSWLSRSLSNCNRLLDPLLVILSDPTIITTNKQVSLFKDGFYILVYQQPFNFAQVLYALKCLLSLARGGTSGLIEITKKQSVFLDIFLIKYRPQNTIQYVTYAELLFDTVSKYIFCEVSSASDMDSELVASIQMTSLELVLLLLEDGRFFSTEKIDRYIQLVIHKLYFAVHHMNLDLQPKLLETLLKLCRRPSTVLGQLWSSFGQSEDLSSFQLMILDALDPENEVLQQSWLEFIFYFFESRDQGHIALFPIVVELASSFRSLVYKSKESFICNEKFAKIFDKQILVLRSIGALLDYILSYGSTAHTLPFQQSVLQSPGGLKLWSGFAHDLVSVEPMVSTSTISLASKPGALPFEEKMIALIKEVYTLFLDIFLLLEDLPVKSNSHEQLFVEYSRKNLSEEVSAIVKCIYMKNPSYFFFSLLHVWASRLDTELVDSDLALSVDSKDILWVVDIANMAPQEFVGHLLDYYRDAFFSPVKSKSLATLTTPITELSVLLLLEAYTHRSLSVEKILEIWPSFLAFHRECLTSIARRRASLLGLLRWIRAMLVKMAAQATHHTLSLDEKRVHRELQDTLQKIADSAILLAAKGFDVGSMVRRKDGSDAVSSFSGISPSNSRSIGSYFSFKAFSTRHSDEGLFAPIIFAYFTSVLVPQLSDLIIEPEKVNGMVSSIVYYLTSPQLRNRIYGQPREVMESFGVVFDLLYVVSQLPSGLKVWKKEFYEFFMDPRFFSVPIAYGQRRHFVNCVMRDDAEKIQDLIGRVSASQSSGIFTSKEVENANRALSVRRLAYIIFCGELDQYLPWLPSTQEKIVEIFKSNVSKPATSALFLLLRVILLRFSNRHLPNLWPIVFTEIIQSTRTFCKLKKGEPEEVEHIFSICKFIELMYKVAFEEIQPYQWIFADDTKSMPVSATYRPSNGLVGRLYSKLFEETDEPLSPCTLAEDQPAEVMILSRSSLMLQTLKCSMEQLKRFFISLAAMNSSNTSLLLEGSQLQQSGKRPADSLELAIEREFGLE